MHQSPKYRATKLLKKKTFKNYFYSGRFLHTCYAVYLKYRLFVYKLPSFF